MTDATQALRPLDRDRLPIGGVFKTTFRIFGRSPLLFLLLGLVAQAAVAARLIIAPPTVAKFGLTEVIVLVVNFLLLFVIQTAITLLAVRLYDDQRASVAEGLSLGVRRFLPMLGTTILVILAIYAGLIAIIVPGIIVALIFAVAVPVCAVEPAGPITSMKRSIFLTRGERWRVLGIYCIFFIPFLILSGLAAWTLTMKGHLEAGQWATLVLQIIWLPLATIFSATIYVELRRLKENVGVAHIFD